MDIKIIYSYDGSKFHGMQRQKDKLTVQGEIERVIFEVFNEKINLISSGRTDANVHALMQVSNFSLKQNIPLRAIKKQLNSQLFSKIKVYNIEQTDKNFNSRYDAKYRVYEYRFKNYKDISPFEANYVSAINDKHIIDIEKINKNLSLFIGEHNFTYYSKTDKSKKNPIRNIEEAYCYEKNGTYFAIIKANSFLKSMIRLIMASCIYEDEETIKQRLDMKLNIAKKILSPNGLYLKEVFYDNENN